MTVDEFSDLGIIIKVIESTLQKSFGYDVINYLMLMMIDKQVHYHIFPRYEKPIKFLRQTWKDQNWPAVPALLGEPLPNAQLKEMGSIIRSNMPNVQEDKK